MKKIVVFLTGILLLALVGCGSTKANQTTISIDKKGRVSQRIIENFDQAHYNVEELNSMIEESVTAYNSSQDGEKIQLKECKEDTKAGQVLVSLFYNSCFDYKSFNQRELFWGSVESAKGTYDFDQKFLDDKGKECDWQQITTTYPSAQVIILNEPVAVSTDRPILCVSDNVEILEETLAKVRSDGSWDNENADTRISDYAYIIYDGEN